MPDTPPPISPPPSPPATIKTVAAQVDGVHKLAEFNAGTLAEFREVLIAFEREFVELRRQRDTLPPPSRNAGDVLLAGLAGAPPVTIESLAPAGYEVKPIPPVPSLAARAGKKSVSWTKILFTAIGAASSIVQILVWLDVKPGLTGPLQTLLSVLARLAG